MTSRNAAPICLLLCVMLPMCCFALAVSDDQATAGGITPFTQDNPKLHSLIDLAIDFLNSKSDTPYLLKFDEMKEKSEQVVQGKLYRLTFYAVHTNCTKNEKDDENKDCDKAIRKGRQLCTVKIWEWRGKDKVTKGSCEDVAEKTADVEPSEEHSTPESIEPHTNATQPSTETEAHLENDSTDSPQL